MEPQKSYERSLRFLLNTLESFKQRIRLAHILLQDIDAEFPGLRHRLSAQEDSSVPQRPLLVGSESQTSTIEHIMDSHFANPQNSDVFFADATISGLDEDYMYTGALT